MKSFYTLQVYMNELENVAKFHTPISLSTVPLFTWKSMEKLKTSTLEMRFSIEIALSGP